MINSLIFYRNWFELAELQTDDELRLAFYDAVMRYAFKGEVPPDVDRGGDKCARAARFAFLTVQPVLDRAASDHNNGRRGGRPQNKKEPPPFSEKENPPFSETETPLSSEKKPPFSKKENPPFLGEKTPPFINGNGNGKGNVNGNATTGGRGGRCKLPELKIVLGACELMAVPRDFAEKLYAEIIEFDGEDRDGHPIGSWRRYFKAAWTKEQARAAAQTITSPDVAPRKISEDDL